MNRSRHSIALIAVPLLLAIGCTAAAAQGASSDNALNLGSSVPKIKEVEEGLFPDDACQELKANGFKCMGFKPPVRFVLPSSSFKVGSADLPDGLKRQLDVFAQVLKIPTIGYGPSGVDYHAVDERARLKDLTDSAKIYADLVTTFRG